MFEILSQPTCYGKVLALGLALMELIDAVT